MKTVKSVHEAKDISLLRIILTAILLIIVIISYVSINKYISTDPIDAEKNIISKTGDGEIDEDDALKLGTEKYYLAMATITSTKSDIDKIYDILKTTDIVIENENLVNELNKFGFKTYTINSSAQIISNYDEAITKNFTKAFINENIMHPNGFIGMINNDYYLIKDKIDNYFFKEANLKLISKTTDELYFKVVNTNYSAKCVSAGSTVPSITCTDTEESKSTDFRLIKDSNNWKISEITLITA